MFKKGEEMGKRETKKILKEAYNNKKKNYFSIESLNDRIGLLDMTQLNSNILNFKLG